MADVQLTIDIAQKLTGQETTAELDRLTSVLRGTSRETESLERAQIQAQNALSGASAEVAGIQSELNGAQQEYAALRRASLEASAAAEKAVASNASNAESLGRAAHSAQLAATRYAAKVSLVESRLREANKAQADYARQARNVAKVTGHVAQSQGDLESRLSRTQGAFGDLGGPIGRLGESLVRPVKGFTDLKGVMGAGNAAALAGVVAYATLAAAVVAITAVAAALTAAMAGVALALADTRRKTELAAEAFDALNPAIGAVRGEFRSITKETGVAAGRLQGLAASLRDAGLSAAQLPGALRAAALAEAGLGEGGADKFIQQIKKGELAVGEFTSTMQRDLGGVVQRQMLGLGNQAVTLGRNMSGLFGGLEIEGALKGISKLVSLFDQTEASGRAIKFLFERFFQPIVDSVHTAATAIEAFALGVLIGLVSLYIKLKPVIKGIAEFFGFDDPTTEETFKKITAAGEVVAYVLAGIGAAFIAVGALIAGAVVTFAAPFLAAAALIYGAVQGVIGAIDLVGDAFDRVVEWISSLDFAELGSQLMQGLAKGITDSISAVVGSVTDAVNATVGAAKSILGISSPSKVFARIGVNTGEGFAGGIEEEQEHAQGALAKLVEPPSLGETALSTMAGPSVTSAASEREEDDAKQSGPSVDLAGAVFNFHGVADAEQAEERFSEVLTRLLEGDAASLGATA